MSDGCEIDGCGRRVMARGWCSGHYQRWRIHGDPEHGGPLRPSHKDPVAFGTCQVQSCDDVARVASRAWCAKHYQRWRKYGDPEAAYTRHNRDRFTTSAGYIRVRVGTNAFEFEHRVVMARILGRPLLRTENVHHINGKRDDNRPANLELWVRSQPPGQRVQDVIAHSIEMLSRYAPERLATPD